jgi:hypothetical protein
MNRMISVALAGALAASAIAATATGASAGGNNWPGPGNGWMGKPQPGPNYHYRNRGPGPGAFIGGTIFGLAVGALAAPMFNPYPYPYAYPYAYAPPPPPPPMYPVYPSYAYDPHIAWCSAQYQSYNPSTNTWVDFYGVVRVCISP